MSHFTVLVIGDDYEGQLAPYDENIEVEPYKHYEKDFQWYMDAWKRRDEPAGTPTHSLQEALENTDQPRLDVDYSNVPDPSIDELVVWLNEEWGKEEGTTYGHDNVGFYYTTTYNPRAKWDWYEVGGRWAGYFTLKAEAMDRVGTLAKMGRPGLMGMERGNDADIVRKGDVDFERMRREAGEAAAARWDAVHALIDELPEALSWKAMLAKHTDEDGET